MLFSFLHILHLIIVILWIGGLAFVTIIIFPVIALNPDALQKVLTFQRVEHRFARLAKYFNALVGITGFTMLYLTGWYSLLFTMDGIALTFMTIVWTFWAIMLFGLEPLVVKKMLERMAKNSEQMDIDTIFSRVQTIHWVLLFVSLAAVTAGALVAHPVAAYQ